MNLELQRKEFFEDRTIGGLYIDGPWFCYTLEDTDRQIETLGVQAKIPGQTAIPRGKYKVTISFSNRFKKMMPQLLDVPCFTGIRIHPGNTPENTEGCILVGVRYKPSSHIILDSLIAYNDLFSRLVEAIETDEIWIDVK